MRGVHLRFGAFASIVILILLTSIPYRTGGGQETGERLSDSPQLSKQSRLAISDTDNIVYVSAVSLWEIAIQGIGKLDLPNDFDDALAAQGFRELPVKWEHTRRNRELPWLHHDPFDRMLIAQAQTEALTQVTADRAVLDYEAECL